MMAGHLTIKSTLYLEPCFSLAIEGDGNDTFPDEFASTSECKRALKNFTKISLNECKEPLIIHRTK